MGTERHPPKESCTATAPFLDRLCSGTVTHLSHCWALVIVCKPFLLPLTNNVTALNGTQSTCTTWKITLWCHSLDLPLHSWEKGTVLNIVHLGYTVNMSFNWLTCVAVVVGFEFSCIFPWPSSSSLSSLKCWTGRHSATLPRWRCRSLAACSTDANRRTCTLLHCSCLTCLLDFYTCICDNCVASLCSLFNIPSVNCWFYYVSVVYEYVVDAQSIIWDLYRVCVLLSHAADH